MKNSLDLLENVRISKKYGSFYWLLDEIKIVMGIWMLRIWIDRFLVSMNWIKEC